MNWSGSEEERKRCRSVVDRNDSMSIEYLLGDVQTFEEKLCFYELAWDERQETILSHFNSLVRCSFLKYYSFGKDEEHFSDEKKNVNDPFMSIEDVVWQYISMKVPYRINDCNHWTRSLSVYLLYVHSWPLKYIDSIFSSPLYLYLRLRDPIGALNLQYRLTSDRKEIYPLFLSFENRWYRLKVSARFRTDEEKESVANARCIPSCQRCDWICRIVRCLVLLLDEDKEIVLLFETSYRFLLMANLSIRRSKE